MALINGAGDRIPVIMMQAVLGAKTLKEAVATDKDLTIHLLPERFFNRFGLRAVDVSTTDTNDNVGPCFRFLLL